MNLEDCQTVLSSSEGESVPIPRYSRGCLSFVLLFDFFFFFFLCWLGRGVLAAVGGRNKRKLWNFLWSFFTVCRDTPSTIVARRRWVSLIVSVSLGRDHRRCRSLGIALRRTRGNSHGSRSRDSAVPIPARRGSTYPLATARTLKHKARTHISIYVSDWYRFENISEREKENLKGYFISYFVSWAIDLILLLILEKWNLLNSYIRIKFSDFILRWNLFFIFIYLKICYRYLLFVTQFSVREI